MNKFAVLSLVICVLGLVSIAFAVPPQLKGKMEAFKEMIKCTHTNCEKENTALKALFKQELDRCLKVCNASEKNFKLIDEEERARLKECFKTNNCKLPMEHIKENRNTPEFKAMKACAEEKCKESMDKLRNFEPSIDI